MALFTVKKTPFEMTARRQLTFEKSGHPEHKKAV
jgi:hypothetical protein